MLSYSIQKNTHFIIILLTSFIFVSGCGGGNGGTSSSLNTNAGNDQFVDETSFVTLEGSSSATASSFNWEQTSGSPVFLESPRSQNTVFLAPRIENEETLTFRLTTTDGEGNTDTDEIHVLIKPVFYSITLSDDYDRCGNPRQQEITISFVDSDNNTESHTFTHSGVEETYAFAQDSLERKTIVIAKEQQHSIFSQKYPSGNLFIGLPQGGEDQCDCPSYNIEITDEQSFDDDYNFLYLSGRGRISKPPIWNDFEICAYQEFSAYTAHQKQQLFKKLEFNGSNDITISEYDEMNSVTLNEGFQEANTISISALSDENSPGRLRTLFSVLDSDFSDGQLKHPESGQITDYAIYINYQKENITAATLPGSYFFDAFSEFNIFGEYHSIKMPATNIDLLSPIPRIEVDDLDIAIDPDRISLTSESPLPFDLAVVIAFPRPGSDDPSVSITAPIIDGQIDISELLNQAYQWEELPFYFYINLTDQNDQNDYELALTEIYIKSEPGQENSNRYISLAAFRDIY